MSNAFDQLQAQVLELPLEQRGQLLDQLIASLERDTEWEQAWAAECARREAQTSDDQWLDGAQVLAALKARWC